MLKVKLLTPTSKAPERAYKSPGYDIFSNADMVIPAGAWVKIPLGFATEFNPSQVCLLMERSGTGSKGFTLMCRVIDCDYRGEWLLCVHNHNKEDYHVKVGEKVAQFLKLKVEEEEVEVTDTLSETSRGAKGFGSTK